MRETEHPGVFDPALSGACSGFDKPREPKTP